MCRQPGVNAARASARGVAASQKFLGGLFILAGLMGGLAPGLAQETNSPPAEYPVMQFTEDEMRRFALGHFQAPSVPAAQSAKADFASSVSLLSRLPYVPSERNQGSCGNCWAWPAHGIMEIALNGQYGVRERLSVQYLNSCNAAIGCCRGGWLQDAANFYAAQGFALPWSNGNAQWSSGSGSCVPCGSIARSPRYPISQVALQSIPTHGVGRSQAIANIKSVLSGGRAVWFGFFLPSFAPFYSFWGGQDESAVWSSFACGQAWTTSAVGHAVLCIGYNDDDPANPYWIMVNSWGTASGRRPNGLFRVSMNLDYDCSLPPYYNLYWETLDVRFAGTPPSVAAFAINNGAAATTGQTVTLNNTSSGNPAEFLASESPTFSGAAWQPYALAPSFVLSAGAGTKTVYFKTRNANGESAVASDSITYSPGTPAWTVMVYLDGDNNLENAAIEDFLEMASVNNPNANIVVQFDRRSGYNASYGDWTTTKRFLVRQGMTPTAGNALQDLGEVNMATPQALTDFINWARTTYPASQYALILWNHGDGWRLPAPEAEGVRGIISDDTSSGDQLEMAELRQALSDATGNGSRPIHVINMDACLMAGLEVAHELRSYANYFVGSAELEPGDGNEYQDILNPSHLSAGTTPEAWAASLVSAYQTRYDSDNGQQTLMAGRLSVIDGLAQKVSDLAVTLTNQMAAERANIARAWSGARHYSDDPGAGSMYRSLVDLHDFCARLKRFTASSGVANQCQAVMNSIQNDLLVASWADSAYSGTTPDQQCFWIYFPPSNADAAWNRYNGTTLSFLSTAGQHWDEFLHAFLDPCVTPMASNLAINNGAASTTSRTVTLNNACLANPTEFMASEFGNFAGAAWQPYSAAPTFTLSAGGGARSVFFIVRNACGESGVASDTITYVEPAPPFVASFAINGGADETESATVTLNNICTGGPLEFKASESAQFAGAAWQSYSSAPMFNLSAGTGGKTVYFVTRNAQGESGVVSDTINFISPVRALVHVDWRNTALNPDGSAARPYPTLRQGSEHLAACGTLRIQAGTYREPDLFTNCMRLESTNGSVVISRAGTSGEPPLVPPSLRLGAPVRRADGSLAMQFQAVAGQHYQILTSTNLTTWELWKDFTAEAEVVELVHPQATSEPLRFFRLVRP